MRRAQSSRTDERTAISSLVNSESRLARSLGLTGLRWEVTLIGSPSLVFSVTCVLSDWLRVFLACRPGVSKGEPGLIKATMPR